MRIAIVGGGASGLAAAWLLDADHAVTLYERAPVLGGHVRTVGGNVACAALPEGVRLDAGVIEFDRAHFPVLHAWLRALDVHPRDLRDGGATRLFRADGRSFASPTALRHDHETPLHLARALASLRPLARSLRAFLRATARCTASELDARTIGSFLGNDDFGAWVRGLLTYAYSTPTARVGELSAALAVPMLRDFLVDTTWTHLPGGVSAYVDHVARSLRGPVRVNARIRGVLRGDDAVTVRDEAGYDERFDAVVLAVPPHRVLPLLLDATVLEHERWSAWQGGVVETVLHTDTGLYARRGVRWFTEFDLFERADGGFGYNAYLNRLAGLDTHDAPHYALAFQLDHELDATKVLHRQAHDVAWYTQEALAWRPAIERAQGERRTWIVGAFLGDGLHEGAVCSALRVAERLGGRALDARPRATSLPAEATRDARAARRGRSLP